MNVNPIKSSSMKLGRFKTNVTYSINDVAIPEVQSVKDLGLTYDANMKFDDYISDITRRAYQRTGLIFRGFISKNTDLLKRAFVTYVRPILEYSTCVWSPYMLKDIRKVEDVQRYFTRRLFPKCSLNYSERLAILGLESLECRRLKYDLKMYFKIIHHHTNLEPSKFFLFQNNEHTNTRGGRSFMLKKHLFSSNQLFHSFCNRAVGCWNSMPEELVAARSCEGFNRGLKNLDVTKFLKGG